MAPHVQSTCLATMLLFENGVTSSALAFNSCGASGLSKGTTSREHQRRNRSRVRPRPSSHAANTPISTAENNPEDRISKIAAPPRQRSVRADIDTCSLNLALLNLSQPKLGQGQGTAGQAQGTGQRQGHQTYDDDTIGCFPAPSSRGYEQGGVSNVLDEVQWLVSRGGTAEAIALLARVAQPSSATSAAKQQTPSSKSAAPVPIATSNSSIGSVNEAGNDEASLGAGFMTVLKDCSKRGMWREARQVLVRHMPTAGLRPTTDAWILAMDACAGAGGSEQAVFLLHEMRSRGVEINGAVYQAAVKACACSGGMTRAIFLLKDAMKRGTPVPPAAVAETILAVTKQRRGYWQQALLLYEAFVELVIGRGRQSRVAGPTSKHGDGVDSFNSPDDLSGAARRIHLLSESASALEEVCLAALEACAAGGQWERALEVLNTLRAGGLGGELSRAAYEKTILLCGRARAWEKVLLLMAEMRADDVALSPATFETTLQGCAATGSWSWARSLLRSVLADGNYRWTLSFRHYIYALSACAGVVDKPGGKETQGAVKFALALVQDLREAGWLEGKQGEDAYVLAMQTCVRAQDAWSALALLDSAQDDGIRQGTALSTAAMQALSGAGEWRAALSILNHVLEEGEQPGGAMYVAAMAACARGGVVDLALELLERVLMEYPGDKETVTAAYHGAIVACAECGQWEKATSLLQRMRQDSLVVVTTAEYNAAILACSRARQSFAALSLLGDMFIDAGRGQQKGSTSPQDELGPNETSYNNVMRAFAQEGRWRTVLDLIVSMRDESGLVPGVSSYNIVVEALAKAGEWQQALGVLEKMKREGIRPTEFTYNCCMTACEKRGLWEETLSLMLDMKEQEDLVPNSYAFSTAMMACSKAGRLDDVLNILEEMRNMPGGGGPNLVNYNIAIGACARASEWERMLKEMDSMKWEDVTPTETTFMAPLDACARSGQISVALTLLARMHENSVSVGLGAYTSALATACRGGDSGAAAELLDEMSAAGHFPNEVTYAVAALACRDGANADAAVDLLRRRKAQRLPPDSVVFGFVVQACCNAGDMERGLDIVKEMKAEGLVPDGDFYNSVIAGISATFSVDPRE